MVTKARTTRAALIMVLLSAVGLVAACLPAPPPGSSSSPSGYLDSVTGGEGTVRMVGWVSDWDTLDPIKVVFWINGQWVSGAFDANKPRPDVDAVFGRGADFGFDETFTVAPGPVTACTVALNVGPGDNTIIGCRETTVLPVPPTPEPTWRTVVNNGDLAPGSDKNFNSYNQPSVNASGTVAFRARTQGQGARGIYSRNPRDASSAIRTIADAKGGISSVVPAPNNLSAEFTEFPAFPRMDAVGPTIATRGQSTSVWEFTPDGGEATRVGTAGVYSTANGALTSSVTLLGGVPGFEYYAVPGAAPGTRFDQFPGSPAVDGTRVAFKGNYTTDEGKTGVFFKDASVAAGPIQVIANSDTLIPNQPDVDGEPGVVEFGSTAPPSAAGGKVVFTGLDNEAAPTLGGVYLAAMATNPELDPLVEIGDRVPGMAESDVFTSIGEGLSFDGRYVTLWGAWGETREITLDCPEDGNKDILAYCNETYPDGFVTEVPVNQGIFIHDTVTDSTRAVAVADAADPDAKFRSFQYWVFSGRPPGVGGSEEEPEEPPRWRASAFAAVSGTGAAYKVAFKGTEPDGTTGIYLGQGPAVQPIISVVDTDTSGPVVDTEAPSDTFVTTVGVERDGFRGRFLALSVAMSNEDASASWGGVYLVATDTLAQDGAARADLGADVRSAPGPEGAHSRQLPE